MEINLGVSNIANDARGNNLVMINVFIKVTKSITIQNRGVARVMNMCTHNARGTDLQSFSETGREWIFPNSWLLFYGGNPPIPAARSPADTVGGPGGLPRGKLKKKIANGGI